MNNTIRSTSIGLWALFVFVPGLFSAQIKENFADSIRLQYKIPELGYAVISSDSILTIHVSGVQNSKTKQKARLNDRFRIGSNTKTVTAYIAALLVKKGELKYETKFFDLYPELKQQSNPAYWNMTLQDLLTLRAHLQSWTYTNTRPTAREITGNEQQQRYAFIAWILRQPPDTVDKTIYWSNPAYVIAGLMMEKASGKSYELLVKEFGQSMNIDFQFGQPNCIGNDQPWGHNANLEPEKPAANDKLNWLSSAGNINVSLPDYAKFIQMQLRGLQGRSELFTAEEFDKMHYGLPAFSYGWLTYTDEETHLKYSYHIGNPGTFLSKVYICKETDRAYVFFANVQSEEAEQGMTVLFNELKHAAGK
jgi:CubicO group peptidase (beta-lactamase class C family)